MTVLFERANLEVAVHLCREASYRAFSEVDSRFFTALELLFEVCKQPAFVEILQARIVEGVGARVRRSGIGFQLGNGAPAFGSAPVFAFAETLFGC